MSNNTINVTARDVASQSAVQSREERVRPEKQQPRPQPKQKVQQGHSYSAAYSRQVAEASNSDTEEAARRGQAGRLQQGRTVEDVVTHDAAVKTENTRTERVTEVSDPAASRDTVSSDPGPGVVPSDPLAEVQAAGGAAVQTSADVQSGLILETSTMTQFEIASLCSSKNMNQLVDTLRKAAWTVHGAAIKNVMAAQMRAVRDSLV